MPEEQDNQLADIIMTIIRSRVAELIKQEISDLQVNTVAFDIHEHRDEIVAFVEEDVDVDDHVRNFFYSNTMSVTVD
jgi:hypothetical protein